MQNLKLLKSKFEPFELFSNPIPENFDLKNKQPSCIYYGIVKNNKNIGNLVVWKQSSTDFWIDQIKIKEKYQNKGFGSQALQLILNKYPNINFHLSGVVEAKNYYLRNGFKIVKFDFERQYIDFEYIRAKN